MIELMAKCVWALSRTQSCPAPALECTSFGVCLAPGFEQVWRVSFSLPTTSAAAGENFFVPG